MRRVSPVPVHVLCPLSRVVGAPAVRTEWGVQCSDGHGTPLNRGLHIDGLFVTHALYGIPYPQCACNPVIITRHMVTHVSLTAVKLGAISMYPPS
jgi:hypothetical protein